MRIFSGIRLRHWRGKGIHSPFMYRLVREVFMKSGVDGPDKELYDRLREMGVSKRNSIVMQNLLSFYGGGYNIMENGSSGNISGLNICVVGRGSQSSLSDEHMSRLVASNGILVVVYGRLCAESRVAEHARTAEYHGVSVKMRNMFLYFFDDKLQKQHYRL